MGEPEGLNEDASLGEAVYQAHGVLGCLDAFLDVSADHRVRVSGSAA